MDALTLATGNLDRPGGTLMSHAVIPLEEMGERSGNLTYAETRSRIGDLPDVNGTFPAAVMAEGDHHPGAGQLRALFVPAGNPVLTVPNSDELEAAIRQLDLHVSLDFYVNRDQQVRGGLHPACHHDARARRPTDHLRGLLAGGVRPEHRGGAEALRAGPAEWRSTPTSPVG